MKYEVLDVRDISLGDATDEEIMKYANQNSFILLTEDTEFAKILRHPKDSHGGIAVLRLPFDFTSNRICLALDTFWKHGG